MPPLTLPRTLVTRILAHAQQSPEDEVCGLIGARDGVPEAVYPIANVAELPQSLFVMEPAAQIEALRRMRLSGEELFGIYHSHPHAPAEPSRRDLAEAAYPQALYLIVSLNTTGVLEMQGFRLHDGEVERVDLEVA
ncbi:MAG: M67 family metallopeptidase [Gammaproteobacteria bacterium]|nr:M67 family metallopeptidase [Gammaproteobacteria bacterium]